MGIDVATVVGTSIAIADAEGLDALTMRRLGAELQVTAMAIYHHVPNKDRLLDLIADESMRTLPLTDLDAVWDQELVRFFVAFHRLYLDHPALAQVMAQRPLEGPVAIGHGERILALLGRAGIADQQAVALLVSLVSYTIGSSLYRLSRATPGRFEKLSAESAPTAYRLRQVIAGTAENDEHFLDGLTRLIESYCGQ